jgi:hypothetical protein
MKLLGSQKDWLLFGLALFLGFASRDGPSFSHPAQMDAAVSQQPREEFSFGHGSFIFPYVTATKTVQLRTLRVRSGREHGDVIPAATGARFDYSGAASARPQLPETQLITFLLIPPAAR